MNELDDPTPKEIANPSKEVVDTTEQERTTEKEILQALRLAADIIAGVDYEAARMSRQGLPGGEDEPSFDPEGDTGLVIVDENITVSSQTRQQQIDLLKDHVGIDPEGSLEGTSFEFPDGRTIIIHNQPYGIPNEEGENDEKFFLVQTQNPDEKRVLAVLPKYLIDALVVGLDPNEGEWRIDDDFSEYFAEEGPEE